MGSTLHVVSTDAQLVTNWEYRFRSIYLAGKVSMYDDWRESLVRYDEGYYAALKSDPTHAHKSRCGGVIFQPDYDATSPDYGADHWPVRKTALFGRYDYTGPYLTDLGHGASTFSGGGNMPQEKLITECWVAIRRSDLVFAWIDCLTAFGTLTELGYAKALGKTLWIAGPMQYADLWFVYEMADRTNFGSDDPCHTLEIMLSRVRVREEGEDDLDSEVIE